MKNRFVCKLFFCILIVLITHLSTSLTYAETKGQIKGDPAAVVIVQPGFKDIVFGNGAVNILIWFLIFLASFTTLTFVYDGFSIIKKRNLLPENLVLNVNSCLQQNDLEAAITVCENDPGPLANMLLSGFANIQNGVDSAHENIVAAAELENEKIIQRISYLNLCGQISPMLGLLGTVVGMVKAFASLAGQAGAAKAQLLALAISGALWTTVAGLLISVPVLIFYTIYKNIATKRLIESQTIATNVIKSIGSIDIGE